MWKEGRVTGRGRNEEIREEVGSLNHNNIIFHLDILRGKWIALNRLLT